MIFYVFQIMSILLQNSNRYQLSCPISASTPEKKTAYELKVETRTLRAYRNNFKYIVKYTCTIL